jgi:putative transposase
MTVFVDEHKKSWGVEPICRVLPIAPSTYYAARKRPQSERALRDEYLKLQIARVGKDNFKVYGANKVWVALNREGIKVARCTVERLMRQMGIRGATRAASRSPRPSRTTGQHAPLTSWRGISVRRAPNRLWVCDLTYVRTWSGYVYVSFIIDCYAHMIVGWQASRSLRTDLAFDALEQAIWARKEEGLGELVHHSVRGPQGEFKWSSQHLRYGGISRWAAASASRRSGRCAVTCGRQVVPRRLVESIESGSGKRSLAALRVRRPRSKPVCRPAVGTKWFRQAGGMPPIKKILIYADTCRFPSERRSRSSMRSSSVFGRSLAGSVVHHRRSHVSFAATRRPAATP